MNLYLISQDINTGYDTYDSAIVAAESEQAAREIHPSGFVTHVTNNKWMGTYSCEPKTEYEFESSDSWVCFSDINLITVELIGETSKEKGVILASFNAG